ncbi:TPA: putative 3',5'-cyclic phosphodiesterase pde-3 [Trebouxia sp. C0005]
MQEYRSGGLYHRKQGGHWKVVLRVNSSINWDSRVQTLPSALTTGGKATTSDRQDVDCRSEDRAWTLEEFRILHQLQKSIVVVAYDSLDSSQRTPKVLFQNADCCKRFGPPRSQVGYLTAMGTLTEEARFSRQQWLRKASQAACQVRSKKSTKHDTCHIRKFCMQAKSTFQSHVDVHALFRPLFSGINKDMPSCLIATDSKVIQVQLGQHQIVSAVLHVMEMDSTSEDLRARAMNERNPVHSMLFCQQGELLTANAAARHGFRSTSSGMFLPSSNIMFRDLFSADFYAGGSEEADTHFKAAMKAVFEEQVGCHRHKQCHKSKKTGKLKWTMMEMWPMTDPVDNSPAVLVKRYNITETMESEHEANVRQTSLERQNEELEQATLAIQEDKQRLEKEAQSLAQQLQAVLNDKFAPQRDFDADTPIDKTLKILQTIIGGGVPTVQDALDLHFILSKSDTDLRQPVGLEEQLMADNRLDSVVGMSMLQLLQGDVVKSDAAVKRVAQRHAGPAVPWTLNALVQEDDEPDDSESRMDELSDGQMELVPYCVMPYVERLLQGAEKNWQFDIFGLAEATPGNTLSLLAFHLFKQAGHVKKFSLDEGKLCRYLRKIEQGYDAGNPYHNSLHVASVLQMTHMLLCHGGLLKSNAFAGSLHLASYWSAVVHDFEHGGLNNDFLIKTAHPIALVYNDQSPLENHHLAAAFRIWLDPQCQYMTRRSSPELVRMGRSCAINQVLGTDMKKHFDIVSRFQAVFKKPPSSNSSSHGSTTPTGHSQDWSSIKPEDQTLIHQMVLKCADIGHLAADPKTHRRWAYQLEEEFFRQGDKEKELGLPVSPLMDRQQTGGMTRSQLGFFSIVGIPLFKAITELFKDAQPMMDGVLANYRMWEAAAAASTPP